MGSAPVFAVILDDVDVAFAPFGGVGAEIVVTGEKEKEEEEERERHGKARMGWIS